MIFTLEYGSKLLVIPIGALLLTNLLISLFYLIVVTRLLIHLFSSSLGCIKK